MRTFIFAKRDSDHLKEALRTLEATRLRFFDGMSFWKSGKRLQLADDDVIIAWDRHLPDIDGASIVRVTDKIPLRPDCYGLFGTAGLPTQYTIGPWKNTTVPQGYIGRASTIRGGEDMLFPGRYQPDFIVTTCSFEAEFKVCIFHKEPIGFFKRVPKWPIATATHLWSPDTNLSHPTVRTALGGWTLIEVSKKSVPPAVTKSISKLQNLNKSSYVVDIGYESGAHSCVFTDISAVDVGSPEIAKLYWKQIQKEMR